MGSKADARGLGTVFDGRSRGAIRIWSGPESSRPGGFSMKVAIFGLGYVGAVTAAGLASRGHEVIGVDVDIMKVDAINGGRSPVVEPGIDALMQAAVAAGRLQATTDARLAIEGADISL